MLSACAWDRDRFADFHASYLLLFKFSAAFRASQSEYGPSFGVGGDGGYEPGVVSISGSPPVAGTVAGDAALDGECCLGLVGDGFSESPILD